MRPSSLLLHIKQHLNLYANSLVIPRDNKLNTPEFVLKAITISVDAGTNPAFKLSEGL
jgi:glutaredoxin 2